jgi:hypothetical protein
LKPPACAQPPGGHWETAQDALSSSAFYGKKAPTLPELTDRFWGGADRAGEMGPAKNADVRPRTLYVDRPQRF